MPEELHDIEPEVIQEDNQENGSSGNDHDEPIVDPEIPDNGGVNDELDDGNGKNDDYESVSLIFDYTMDKDNNIFISGVSEVDEFSITIQCEYLNPDSRTINISIKDLINKMEILPPTKVDELKNRKIYFQELLTDYSYVFKLDECYDIDVSNIEIDNIAGFNFDNPGEISISLGSTISEEITNGCKIFYFYGTTATDFNIELSNYHSELLNYYVLDFSYIEAKGIKFKLYTSSTEDSKTTLVIKQCTEEEKIHQHSFENMKMKKKIYFKFTEDNKLLYEYLETYKDDELQDVSKSNDENEVTTFCVEGTITFNDDSEMVIVPDMDKHDYKVEKNELDYPQRWNDIQHNDENCHICGQVCDNMVCHVTNVKVTNEDGLKKEYKVSTYDCGKMQILEDKVTDSSTYNYLNCEAKIGQMKKDEVLSIKQNIINGSSYGSFTNQVTGLSKEICEVEFIKDVVKKGVDGYTTTKSVTTFEDINEDNETPEMNDNIYGICYLISDQSFSPSKSGESSITREMLSKVVYEQVSKSKGCELNTISFPDVLETPWKSAYIGNEINIVAGSNNNVITNYKVNGNINNPISTTTGVTELIHSLVTTKAQNKTYNNKSSDFIVSNDNIIDISVSRKIMAASISNPEANLDITFYGIPCRASSISNTTVIEADNPYHTIIFNGESLSEDIITETSGIISIYSNHTKTATINLIEKEDEDDEAAPINVENISITSTGIININLPNNSDITETPVIKNIDLFEGSVNFTGQSVSRLPQITITIYKDVEPSSVISGIDLKKVKMIRYYSTEEKEKIKQEYKSLLLLMTLTKDETLKNLLLLKFIDVERQLRKLE